MAADNKTQTATRPKYTANRSPIDRQREMSTFFDEFVEVFRTFDGNLIAIHYAAPYLAIHADGSTGLFIEHKEIGPYFQRVVDSYQQRGCRSCRYKNLKVVALGEQCCLSTVTWELLTEKGAVLSVWRESYTMLRSADGLHILTSVDHSGSLSK